MNVLIMLSIILGSIHTEEINDKETQESIVIEDYHEESVDAKHIPSPSSTTTSSDSNIEEEQKKLRLIMDGLYCFSSVQHFLHYNPPILSKIQTGQSHETYSGKLISALFGHCQTNNKHLTVEERFKKLQEKTNAEFYDQMFADVDIEGLFESSDTALNTTESELLYQFNEIANEMKKRETKNSSNGKQAISQMSPLVILICVLVIIGLIIFIWNNLFGKTHINNKRKRRNK